MDDLDVPSSPAHLSLFRSYEDVSNSTDPGIRVEPTPEKTLLVPLVSNNSPSSPLVTPRLDHISYGTELGDPGATDDTLDGSFHGATRDIQEDVQEEISSLLPVDTMPPKDDLTQLLNSTAFAVSLHSPLPRPAANSTTDISSSPSPYNTTTLQDIVQVTPSAKFDLISFESFSTPAPVFRQTSPKASSSLLPPSSNGPSTQDLLAGSPNSGETFSGNISAIPIVHPTDHKGKRKTGTQTVREYLDSNQRPGSTLLTDEAEMSSAPSLGLEIPNKFSENIRTPTRRRSPRGSTPEATLPSGGDEVSGDTQRKKQDTSGDHRDEGNNTIDGAVVDLNQRRKSSQFQRELGSLSPASTQLLSHLLESPAKTPPVPAQRCATDRGARHNQSQLIFPFPQPSPTHTPQRPTSPIRFLSPVRSVAPRSPSRFRLQPADLDDPNRTPARRIPIEEAIAKGRIFPSKALERQSPSKLGTLRFQSPVLKIPANDSPARRLPIPHVTDQKSRIDVAGPAQTTIGKPEHRRLKSSNVDTKERVDSKKAHQLSNDLSSSGHPVASSSTLRPIDLPYPIVTQHMEAVEITNGSPKPDPLPSSSPSKSQLKQTLSRIPRAKPYARPILKISEKGRSALVTETDDATKETSRHAMKLDRVGSVTPGPHDSKSEQKALSREQSASLPMLKRKRVEDKKSLLEKSVPHSPRLVESTPAPKDNPHTSADPHPGTKKPRQIRRVVDRPVEPQVTQLLPEIRRPEGARHENERIEEMEESGIPDSIIPSCRVTVSLSPEPNQATPPEDFTKAPRRTGRVRKQGNIAADVDVTRSSDGKAPPRRRRAQTPAKSDLVVFGMSAVALKALTTSNTERNQRYLAAKLETEVVRKEGMRPESPTVKIKTVMQRQQDERHKQRRQRAERRASRSEDGSTAAQSETDDQSEDDFRSIFGSSDSDDPLQKRYRRGPGDEEDYETPKSGEPFNTDDSDDKTPRRHVKWDRGLFTTVYLDEVNLGGHRPAKENIATKGCLAATAKALTLDDLGNVQDANSPLTDLVEECVVVKKFVYDNDLEPEPEAIVVKNTRLRSRKGKN